MTPRQRKEASTRLYASAVAQARMPAFYAWAGIPDTLDGRFEMLVLHVYLLLRRLKAAGEDAAALRQTLVDAMAADFDANLRELGAGDLGVGRRVTGMVGAFLGRVAAYDIGLEGSNDVLREAIERNAFGTVPPPPLGARRIADYVRQSAAGLAAQPSAALMAGQVEWMPIEQGGVGR